MRSKVLVFGGAVVFALLLSACPRESLEEKLVQCELDRQVAINLCDKQDAVLDSPQVKACKARAEAEYLQCIARQR